MDPSIYHYLRWYIVFMGSFTLKIRKKLFGEQLKIFKKNETVVPRIIES